MKKVLKWLGIIIGFAIASMGIFFLLNIDTQVENPEPVILVPENDGENLDQNQVDLEEESILEESQNDEEEIIEEDNNVEEIVVVGYDVETPESDMDEYIYSDEFSFGGEGGGYFDDVEEVNIEGTIEEEIIEEDNIGILEEQDSLQEDLQLQENDDIESSNDDIELESDETVESFLSDELNENEGEEL